MSSPGQPRRGQGRAGADLSPLLWNVPGKLPGTLLLLLGDYGAGTQELGGSEFILRPCAPKHDSRGAGCGMLLDKAAR